MPSFSWRAVCKLPLHQESEAIFSIDVSPFNAPFQTLNKSTALIYFINMLHACMCTHGHVLSPKCKPIWGQREECCMPINPEFERLKQQDHKSGLHSKMLLQETKETKQKQK